MRIKTAKPGAGRPNRSPLTFRLPLLPLKSSREPIHTSNANQ